MEDLPPTEEMLDSDLKTEYITILKESNKLVKYLNEELDTLTEALKKERERNVELQAKLELYYETGVSNISRFTFRNYVKAAIGREETISEWKHFIYSFMYVDKGLSRKIYDWIDYHILKKW